MTASAPLQIALLTLTFAFGFAIIAYGPYAEGKGWPVGEWYASGTSFIMIFGFLGVGCSPIAALLLLPWWSAIIVVLGGFFVALALTRLLRTLVQVVAPVGLLATWIADIVYVLP